MPDPGTTDNFSERNDHAADELSPSARELLQNANQYRELLLSIARYEFRIDESTAEDIVQKTLIRALTYYPPKFVGRGLGLEQWLTWTCRSECQAHLRESRFQPVENLETVIPEPSSPDTAEMAEMADEVDRLRTAITQIPEQEREAIFLKYFGDMGAGEIAATMSLTKIDVRQLVERARDHLTELLARPKTTTSDVPKSQQKPSPPPIAADVLEVPPAVERSLAMFRRELPSLLNTHLRRWVAYIDGKRVRIADTQTELYRYCLDDLGLDHDKFIVRCIIPDSGPEIEYTLR